MSSNQTQRATGDSSDGYFICGSPRSGSTTLCDLLARTGVAGNPESYFRTESIADYAKSWGCSASTNDWGHSYIEGVVKNGTGPDGSFGLRIMWSNMPMFLRQMASLYSEISTDKQRIQQAFGVNHFVYLYREDKVAQAVSLVLAKQTGLWHLNADRSIREGTGGAGEPEYDPTAIKHELDMLISEAHGWSEWFDEQTITPLRLSYEDLATAPQAALAHVLSGIGKAVEYPLPAVGTSPTNTVLNAVWRDRFVTESANSNP